MTALWIVVAYVIATVLVWVTRTTGAEAEMHLREMKQDWKVEDAPLTFSTNPRDRDLAGFHKDLRMDRDLWHRTPPKLLGCWAKAMLMTTGIWHALTLVRPLIKSKTPGCPS